ncbi:hypothetical protein [Streptomyces sp. NPDC001774]
MDTKRIFAPLVAVVVAGAGFSSAGAALAAPPDPTVRCQFVNPKGNQGKTIQGDLCRPEHIGYDGPARVIELSSPRDVYSCENVKVKQVERPKDVFSVEAHGTQCTLQR